MEEEGSEKETVVTQISIGGFDSNVSAKELVQFLEDEIGVVFRCRLKTSWTPPESYPIFDAVNPLFIDRTDESRKVQPHAFVHFATSCLVNQAMETPLVLHNRSLKVSLGPKNPFRMNQMRRTTTPIRIADVILEIGILARRDEFLSAWKGPFRGLDFLVDPFDGSCKFCFTRDTAFALNDSRKIVELKCDFKVDFMVRDIIEIKQYTDTSHLVILLQLASSPRVWYRSADDDIESTVPFDLLDDDDPWIRSTDFTPSGAIGRCNFYRVSIPPRHGAKLEKAMAFFKDRRVQAIRLRSPIKIWKEPDFGAPMSDPFYCIHGKEGIPFEVIFLVNVAVHKGILNQHQMENDFFELLRNQPKDINIAALKHIYSSKRPVFDAYRRLRIVQEWLLRNPKHLKIPRQLDDIAEVRRLVITPTRAYCLPPEIELSNRVLRKFKAAADRFLRVNFMEEGMMTINLNVLSFYAAPIVKELTSNSFQQKTKIFDRVKSMLSDGFDLCGRRYSFLAFSSNQLRDQSAWFFADDSHLNVSMIHSWMGKFTNRNVAKCASRMGLCFSSTYATVEVPVSEVNYELPDVKRNGYVFSDGIGTMTPELALEVAEKLKLDMFPPSAYQIRYAGCKGVIACWPSKGNGKRLALRPSMNKFISEHTTLEICSWTRFQPGYLNRQIVTLLSTLNVSDEIFKKMQDTIVSKLNGMLTNADLAFDILTTSCAEPGSVAAIMLSAGFKPQSEPHLLGMLTCLRAAQLSGLREKTRIFVPSGRWLMGCFDELAVLEQGQCFIQVSTPSLENCFHKHGSRFSDTKRNLEVITGHVVIAKNPCLHPGDIRILEAVDSPGLRHLSDCLVFPQKGDRPHTNEASGSDLDGDLYFVTWDESLIPPGKKSWNPMEYAPAEPRKLPRNVNKKDIVDFFSRNMVNEHLGTICNSHVVHADLSEHGALDEKCLKLAELAATAVDFPKTGHVVTMPGHMKPKLYPDFMGKEAYQSYKSTKILGRLYRQIKDWQNDETSASSYTHGSVYNGRPIPYDADLEVPGSSDFIAGAWEQKRSYDEQLKGLMFQYKVKREEEIVTGQIWSMPKYNSRKQGDLKERLKHSYSGLRKEFRQNFENMDSDFESLSDNEKSALYEKKASAWYQVAYGPEWVKKAEETVEAAVADEVERAVFLSFAWIPADYLARVKIRRHRGEFGSGKPIDSLGQYLSERV